MSSQDFRRSFTLDTTATNRNFETLANKLNKTAEALERLNKVTENGSKGTDAQIQQREKLIRRYRDLQKEQVRVAQSTRQEVQTLREAVAVQNNYNEAIRRSVRSKREEVGNNVTATKTLREAVEAYKQETIRKQETRKVTEALARDKRRLASASREGSSEIRRQVQAWTALNVVMQQNAAKAPEAARRLSNQQGISAVRQLQTSMPEIANSQQFIREAQNIEERLRRLASTSKATGVEIRKMIDDAVLGKQTRWRSELVSTRSEIVKNVEAYRKLQNSMAIRGNTAVRELQRAMPQIANSRAFIREAQAIEERIRKIALASKATKSEIRTMISDAAVGKQRQWRSKLVKTNAEIYKQVNAYRQLGSGMSTWSKRAVEATHAVDVSWRSYVRYFLSRLTYRVFIRLAQGMREGVQAAMDLQLRIAEIRTISQDSIKSIRSWTSEFRALSDAFPQSTLDIAEGAYQALSNQVADASTVTGFLTEALRLSIVTVATTTQAVNALSSVINSYGRTAGAAREISAQFFKVVELGRVRLEEVADDFGNITALAAQVGIEFAEVGAAMTTITRQGIRANTAMTLIRNVLLKLIQPTENMKSLFREWGVETAEQAVQTFGFIGVLEKLEAATRGSSTEISNLFSRIRATVGAAALFSGDNLARFASDYRAILFDSADAYDEATRRAFDAPARRAQIELQKLKNFFMVDLGTEVLRVLVETTEAFGGSVTAVTALTKQVLALGLAFVSFKITQKAVIKSTALYTGLVTALAAKMKIAVEAFTWTQALSSLKLSGIALTGLIASLKVALPLILAAGAAWVAWKISVKQVEKAQQELARRSAVRLLDEMKRAEEVREEYVRTENAVLNYQQVVQTGSRRVAQAIANERKELLANQDVIAENLKNTGEAFETAFNALQRTSQRASSNIDSMLSSLQTRRVDIQFELFTENVDGSNRLLTDTQDRLKALSETAEVFRARGLRVYDADNLEDARRFYGEALNRQRQLRDAIASEIANGAEGVKIRREYESAQTRYLSMLHEQERIEKNISHVLEQRRKAEAAAQERIANENQQIASAFRNARDTTFDSRIDRTTEQNLTTNREALDRQVAELTKAQDILLGRGNIVEANLLGNFVTDLRKSFEAFESKTILEAISTQGEQFKENILAQVEEANDRVQRSASQLNGTIETIGDSIQRTAAGAGAWVEVLNEAGSAVKGIREGEMGVEAALQSGEALRTVEEQRIRLAEAEKEVKAQILEVEERRAKLVERLESGQVSNLSGGLAVVTPREWERQANVASAEIAELEESLGALQRAQQGVNDIFSRLEDYKLYSETLADVTKDTALARAELDNFKQSFQTGGVNMETLTRLTQLRTEAGITTSYLENIAAQVLEMQVNAGATVRPIHQIIQEFNSANEETRRQLTESDGGLISTAMQGALAEMVVKAREYREAMEAAEPGSYDYRHAKLAAQEYYDEAQERLRVLATTRDDLITKGADISKEALTEIFTVTRNSLEQMRNTVDSELFNGITRVGNAVSVGINGGFNAVADTIDTRVIDSVVHFRDEVFVAQEGVDKLLASLRAAQVINAQIRGSGGDAEPAQTRNAGGWIFGTGNRDTVPAMLTPGEFVVNKAASATFAPLLEAINSGRLGNNVTSSNSTTNVTINVSGNNVTGDGGVSPETARQVAEIIRNDVNMGRMRKL